MIALAPGDEAVAVILPDLDEILPRHFQCRLDGFRAAGHEIDFVDPVWRHADEQIRQFFGGGGGKERSMGEWESVRLGLDRLYDIGIGMTEATDRGAAGTVQVTLAVRVNNIDSITFFGARHVCQNLSLEYVGHVCVPLALAMKGLAREYDNQVTNG